MSSPSTQNVSDTKQKTQTAFVLLTLITQASHGVLNTTFVAPPTKPSWFDDLSAKLDAAKANATDWVDNIAPGITGGVPVQVINYGNTYKAMTAAIQKIADQYPDAQGADDPHVKEVLALVAALQKEVTKIITNAQGMSDTLKTWGDKMQKSHDDLSSGAANIQSAETDLQADIDKMNHAIDTLNSSISAENKAIAASAIGIGVGLLLTVVGIALAPETGGTSLLVAGTGALLIVGGAVTWGVMQHKINEQYSEIAKDQNELNADQAQMVALKGLATSTSQAVDYINTCTTALSEFRTSWTVFQDELQSVSDNLSQAEDPQNLSTVVQAAFTQVAANDWADATQFAQSLVNAPVKVASTNMSMDGQIPQAA
jgi:hypothetical protein